MLITGVTLLVLIIIFIVSGYRTFEPDTVAVGYFLGIPWKVIGPGRWGWFPPFLSTVMIININTQRIWAPIQKEKIVRDDDIPLKADEARPIRVTHASAPHAVYWVPQDPKNPRTGKMDLFTYEEYLNTLSDAEKKAIEDDELESSITMEVIGYVDISPGKTLDDPDSKDSYDPESLFNFVKNIRSIEAAGERIRGEMKSTLQELMGTHTARNSINSQAYIELLLKERMERLIGEQPDPSGNFAEKPWGVNVSEVRIEEFNPGKRLNQARADRAASISNKIVTIEASEAQATATRNKAEADRDAAIAEGVGEAGRLIKIAEAVEKPGGRFAASLDVTRDTVKYAKVVIANSDAAGLTGVITSLATTTAGLLKEEKSTP